MRALAPAKLNLSLHMTGRRADGYHDIASLVVFTGLADTLSVEVADTLSLDVIGEFAADAGGGADNLVLKTARLLQETTGCTQGARCMLDKAIPVGAGLGGGSSDAAAALRLLNTLWALGLSDAQLHALAPRLGADVAMFLQGTPLIARGIGDQLEPVTLPWPAMHAVLVHPRKPLLTAAVYRAFANEPLRADAVQPLALEAFVKATRNDLQRPAITLMPEIAEILLALETAPQQPMLARMTGSGACCFALYAQQKSAEAVASALGLSHPGWWVRVTEVAAPAPAGP